MISSRLLRQIATEWNNLSPVLVLSALVLEMQSVAVFFLGQFRLEWGNKWSDVAGFKERRKSQRSHRSVMCSF